MKRLYVRSHTEKIVLVATYKDDEFQNALLYLSAFPLQAFLYETQGKELYGDKLKQELTALIAYAKEIRKEFWCIMLDEENLTKQELDQRISSTPTVDVIWKKFHKARKR